MKKLLTLLGITAFALGAFADAALPSGTSFENHTHGKFDFTGDEPETEGAKYWVSTASDIEASVTTYAEEGVTPYAGDRPAQFSGNNTQYLNIESASAPLYRAILPVSGELDTTDSLVRTNIGSGLYVDTLVQFSVAQGDQDVTDGNVKLAIWVQTGEEDGTPTNFYVHAGYFQDSSTLVTNNYKMTTPQGFDFNGWHRLTVKAIGNIGGNFVGFVVFVDDDMLTRADDATIGTSPELTAEAQQFAAGLLPSAVDNTNEGFDTLSAVGFSGNGSVDDISFTATAPDFAKSELVFSLTVGEGVTGFTLTDSENNSTNVTGVVKDAVVNFTIAGFATDVTVSAITYAADYKNATLSDEVQGKVNGLVFALNDGATNPGATISAVKDNFIVGEAGYPTFAAAIAAVSVESDTIVLNSNYVLKEADYGVNGESVDVTATMTIDLNGYSIATAGSDPLFYVDNDAILTIVNSGSSDASITSASSDGVVYVATGGVVFGQASDTYFVVVNGEVFETSGLNIVKGKFDEASNSEDNECAIPPEAIDQDSELEEDPDDGYWVVDVAEPAPTPTFKVLLVSDEGATTNGLESIQAAFDDATDGDLIVFLEDVDSTITLKDDTMTYVFDPNGHQFATATPFATGDGVILGGLIQNQDGTWSQSVVNNKVSTWTNAEGDGLWATAGNWSSGLVPGQYTTVTFDGNATVGLGAEDDARSVASLVVNGNVTLRHNTQNYAYWPCVNVCGGNVSGTGTLTLERAGIKGNGGAVEINCDLAFYNDTTATGSIKDSYMENGTFTVNGDVSGTGYLKVAAATTFNGDVTLGASAYAMLSVQARTVFNGAVALGDFGVVEMQTASHSFGENATLTGTGRVVCYTVGPNASLKTLLQNGGENGWTGTCELKKGNSAYKITGDNLKPDNYGNADSTVCYNGVTGYFATGTYGQSYTICSVGCLEIGSNGFTLTYNSDTDLYSDRQYIFASALTGSGTISFGTKTGDKYTKYIFTGDVSGFTGGINFEPITSNRPVVVFKTAPEVLTAPTDYGQIIVEAGCTGARAVNAVAAWTAPGGFIVNGELNVASTGSLACDSIGQKIAGNGVISYAAKPASAPLFNDSWAGTFVANWTTSSGQAIPIDGYGVAGSTVKIAQTSTGHFSNAAANANPAFPGTLEIASGVTMTVDDSWASHANKSSVARLTGAGNLVLSHKTTGNSWGVNQPYTFTVVDGFTGTITAGHDFKLVVGTIKLASAPAAGDRVLAVTVADNGAVDISSTTITVGEEVLTPDLELKSDGIYVAVPSSPAILPDTPATLDVDTTLPEADQQAAAEAAAATLDVSETADAIAKGVDQTTWNGYFTKSVQKVNKDEWVATATLNPAAVLPVDGVEEKPLTTMLESVVTAALDDEASPAVPTKAGLYYWIAGATDVGAASYTPGTATLGDGTTLPLAMPELDTKDGKAFYKVCVDVAAPSAD